MIIFKEKILKYLINSLQFKLYRKFTMVDKKIVDVNVKNDKKSDQIDYVEKYKRVAVDNLLTRKFFVIPSFEIYGGVAGFFDYGHPGCALKNNIESFWREHFILEENMLEISGPCLTPEIVLKTSVNI